MESEVERLTLTVVEAGRALGISRSTAYQLANEGVIPTLRLGKRLVVPRVQLERLLAGETKVGQSMRREVQNDRAEQSTHL